MSHEHGLLKYLAATYICKYFRSLFDASDLNLLKYWRCIPHLVDCFARGFNMRVSKWSYPFLEKQSHISDTFNCRFGGSIRKFGRSSGAGEAAEGDGLGPPFFKS